MMPTSPQPTRIGLSKNAAAVVLLCFGGPRAEAHLVTTGLGPVYDGIAHLALSPAEPAVVVVLTLLAAMRGPRQGRVVLALLPAVWLVSGLTGLMFPINASLSWAAGVSLLLAGAVVAAHRNLPLPVVSTLAAVTGAFYGFLTGAALAGTPFAVLELTGTLVTLIIVVTLLTGLWCQSKRSGRGSRCGCWEAGSRPRGS